jgi:potassium uptake TrkH family protein
MANWGKDFRHSEKLFRVNLLARDILSKSTAVIKSLTLAVLYFATVLFFLLFVYYIGFSHTDEAFLRMRRAFHIVFILLFISRLIVGILSLKREKRLSFGIRISVLVFSFFVFLPVSGIVNSESVFWNFFGSDGVVIVTSFVIGILEIPRIFRLISSVNFPPALIFSSSFLLIILIGSGLLMLPNSRTVPLRYQDVLFTSVSAVCVTGLTVTDTVSSFTYMGKIIILCLIQLGGLGIMTFTGFFSYLFTSKSSLQERLLLKDIFSSESLGNLFKILIKILFFTFLLEAGGAVLIYYSLGPGSADRVFYSMFHSVSAFCNAGFSVFPDGLMSESLNKNYILLSSITILIIAGGLGFPVMIRFYSVVKSRLHDVLDFIFRRQFHLKRERLDVGSRIALITTLLLIISGTIILFLTERKSSISGMSIPGQLFLSYFNSVTARTAGFNMSDLTILCNPSVFILIMLMWIGASPGSTGGGIKTSTFSLAVLSSWSNIRGRKSLEIGRTEINPGTLNRVLSIITLSLLFIGTGFFGLLIAEPGKNPVHLLFEAVSAFSTTGLSLADSSTLSHSGKSIVMMLMFAGRVGPLTLLTGLFFAGSRKYYSYPGKFISIN